MGTRNTGKYTKESTCWGTPFPVSEANEVGKGAGG